MRDGLLVVEERPLRITASGFIAGGFFIDVEGGTAGLKVTSSTTLPGPFADQAGATEADDGGGQPNRFFIPDADLPPGRAFFRAEIER